MRILPDVVSPRGPRAVGTIPALAAVLTLLVSASCSRQAPPSRAAGDYSGVVSALEELIVAEMEAKELPALSVALVDAGGTVWAAGFGSQDPDAGEPATAETIYRVGSVSKLFTDIAVMQLVEKGELDLDAPLASALPEIEMPNASGVPITLRQLMSHRAGLVREPPVGHYFDPTEPSLAATVRSLSASPLVYTPGTRHKYSNAGIALVGYVLEATRGEPFPTYLARTVLQPLGMDRSAFEPGPETERSLAKSWMWSYDGRRFSAPTFQLGMSPAGSMYAPVTDLARFIGALLAGGVGERGRILETATLAEMWTPQFADPGAAVGRGIGFGIASLDGHRRVGHGGAIYGFSTELALLPDDTLGVVVATTLDFSNGVTTRIANEALRLMLAVREGRNLPPVRRAEPLAPGLAESLAGSWWSGSDVLTLLHRDGRLYLESSRGGFRTELRALGDTLVVDDRMAFGTVILPREDVLLLAGRRYTRVETVRPPPAPERWAGLVGEYGWDHNVLFILERDRRLWALVEWLEMSPLEEVSEDVYRFPDDRGLYHGEGIVFERDGAGRAARAVMAGIPFERRATGPEDGAVFRIEPVRPIDELRREALAADPPAAADGLRAPDLVELTELDPTIRLDVRYAGSDNFMSAPFYTEARAFLQRPAAEALVRVHRRLGEVGYGLLIHDAYRPWHVTKMFWDATPASMKQFVANPASGSRHNRGSAVDLTLFDRSTGRPVAMPGVYDEFSERSYPDYPGGTALQRWHRELLRAAMEAEGFRVYEFEWWHFDHEDWARYPVLDLTFEELRR